ncbi:NUDIX domain-containing protein [Streptomyces sp. CMB-StM0423]|uniref:NUDIX domain-containing protein n=1 Tax=Streptomyces sp. CMB-StM0423 TaxID=2059884 RepID=UPI000C70525C|nr:NUDIX domain-containing protein [Streptomyces sp. CMB-StM0423]AUH41363.1 NUDIX domain-containing protein [Streptomyces sp. CMB-StM0423]
MYVVNVCVALRRRDQWLLIVRHPDLGHAGGTLAVPGGKVEAAAGPSDSDDVLEATARRETAEEVGVDLTGVPLHYAESTFFVSDTGNPVVNVLFAAHLPENAAPHPAAPAEVSEVLWRTQPEVEATAGCPPWTVQNIRRAAAALGPAQPL